MAAGKSRGSPTPWPGRMKLLDSNIIIWIPGLVLLDPFTAAGKH
jgi:hypothetical protein